MSKSPETSDAGHDEAGITRSAPREVARALRLRIQNGELKPGEWLREVKLAEELGVGRSAIREALRLLQQDGLVELEKFRGARVTAPSLYELFDLFEVRAALFGLVARFACFRAPDADIAEIAARIERLIESVGHTSAEDRVKEGIAIGASMALHANRDARDMMNASHRKARWHFSYLGIAESRGSYGPLEDWRDLASALRHRDAEAAAAHARRIIYFTQGEVTKSLVARGAAPPV
ncbi:GntR family transcriptional regulator [Phenylobacterium sp.]|jgi:DNA-binding GntR family transcriptional regulator|uniref:GntR family transcriptional regulator n=1 Tax=Phenylobacterium sp. TaxID=1871053 RepID=UPI002F3FD611